MVRYTFLMYVLNKINHWEKMARYKLFDKHRDEPFLISRTGIDEFLRCPRTFVLKRKFGIKPPSMPPFTLAIATDHLLKNEFDQLREKQSSDHWIFRKFNLNVVPYEHPQLNTWRSNFKGITYFHKPTNMIVSGAVDDIWKDQKTGQLCIVDYKSTSKKDDPEIESGWGYTYKRQMEVYQWLFRKNCFNVSNTGYFLYVNGIKGDNTFYDNCDNDNHGFMKFKTTLIPYNGNSSWVDSTLVQIKDTLLSETLPKPNNKYDLNTYYLQRSRIEAEIG